MNYLCQVVLSKSLASVDLNTSCNTRLVKDVDVLNVATPDPIR